MTVSCFASASLDTNILIHLWKAENEDMLGKMFDKAYVYQWLLDVELRHHAEESLLAGYLMLWIRAFLSQWMIEH